MPELPVELKMFLHAETFRVASDLLLLQMQSAANSARFAFPLWVNQAFACELYLKCLIDWKAHPASNIHDLGKLFERISKEHQAVAIRHYETIRLNYAEHLKLFVDNPELGADLHSVMVASAKVFNSVRYAFEGFGDGKHLLTFDVLLKTFKSAALEIHPEWPSGIELW